MVLTTALLRRVSSLILFGESSKGDDSAIKFGQFSNECLCEAAVQIQRCDKLIYNSTEDFWTVLCLCHSYSIASVSKNCNIVICRTSEKLAHLARNRNPLSKKNDD